MKKLTLLLLALCASAAVGQGLLTTPSPTPTATPVPLAQVRAQVIRASFQQAALYNLRAYRDVRTALLTDEAATLAELGVTRDQLLAISAALRQAMALTDPSLATQFDTITAQTSPTPTPTP